MRIFSRILIPALTALLWVSCQGNHAATVADVADLSPYLSEDGTYELTAGGVSFKMVPVAPGFYQMGETFEQKVVKNPDIHPVFLDGFAIGEEEVSQELWKAVMGSNPSPKEKLNAPVTRISWEDAVKFTVKLSQMTGLPLRLPTEAEWEFAARGGNRSLRYRYSGSNDGPGAVNELGIKNMSGGVWEWCNDVWTDDLGDEPGINPVGPESGDSRVLRGGSAADPKIDCIISSRKQAFASSKSGAAGLRLAISTGEKCPQEILDILTGHGKRETSDLAAEDFTVGDVTFRMMPVEGGSFTMGATIEQLELAKDDEKPAHQVKLDTFKIGQYEVTCALWKAVMGYLPPNMKADNHPVGNVTWYDAQLFIRRLNELTGRQFRLPTEAEWEYAARGGQRHRGFVFAGANRSAEVAQNEKEDLKTRPVGQLRPNELGTYDMSGNAWEWCQDYFGPYSAEDAVNPSGPEKTESGLDFRVMRGGSAAAFWDKCRTANRSQNRASYFKSTIGFRLAL